MTTTTTEVNGRELLTLLRAQRGAFPVTLDTRTSPKLKSGNPWPCGSVTKECTINGIANFVYQSSVRRHVDPTYEVGHRLWGEHDPKARCIVHHKGKLYLELRVGAISPPVYRNAEGEDVTAEVTPWLRDRGDRPLVDIKAYGFDSICRLTFGGHTYTLPSGS